MRPWDQIISDQDRAVLERGGYGHHRPLGGRPAVLLIDIQHFMVGIDAPILEQIDRYPSGCGTTAWAAVRRIVELLASARRHGVPAVYVRTALEGANSWLSTSTRRDISRYLPDHPDTQIVGDVAPHPGEVVVQKAFPDAFLGTPLLSRLVAGQIDTLLVVGGSTSGCVRATVTTAAALGYRVAVVEQCLFDRIDAAHRMALMDMWRSLAQVISLEESEAYMSKSAEAGEV